MDGIETSYEKELKLKSDGPEQQNIALENADCRSFFERSNADQVENSLIFRGDGLLFHFSLCQI